MTARAGGAAFTPKWQAPWMMGAQSQATRQTRWCVGVMLHYTLVFLIVAAIAAVLGFGGFAGAATGIAKALFIVFLVLSVIAFLRRAK